MNKGDTDPLVVGTGPDGGPAAFPLTQWREGQKLAAELGFRNCVPQQQGPDLNAGTERLMDSKQLGELFGINDTTVEQMAKDGRLPSVRIGRLLRFQPSLCLAALRVNDGRL